MSLFVDNKWSDNEAFIICDCDAEGLHLFIESTALKEPLVGFSYFQSFRRHKVKQFYFEFGGLDEFRKFKDALINPAADEFVCLCNYYGMVLNTYEGALCVDIYKFNKKFKPAKKPCITLSFDSEKCKVLKTELDTWLENYK